MRTVKHILKNKKHLLWSTTPETPVFEALQTMAEKDIGALVVVEKEHLVGIFSERDYARKVILKGKSSKNTPVKEIMTTQVITVQPQQSVAECMAIMTRHHIRHLPVVQDRKLVGLISIGDVLQSIIAEQEDNLQRLENAQRGSDLD